VTFDTTPKPAFLRALQAQNWKVSGALSELVDNSFGPARGDANRCEIVYESSKRMLSVFDNGKGMDGIGRLFQLGNAIGRAPGDIGLYGAGGTMAIIWLAERVHVWTLRGGRVNADSVIWADQIAADAYPQVSDRWEKATAANTPAELLAARHGTLIDIRLRPERTFHISNVQRDLSETYAPALRKHKKLTWTTIGKNGITQDLTDPLHQFTAGASVDIEGFLEIPDGTLLGVRGQVGQVPGLSLQQSNVAFGYGPRVIFKTRECFRSPAGDERFTEAGVAGYIDLLDGWQPYLTLTKDEIADAPVREALMAWIFEKVRPILQAVTKQSMQMLLDNIALSITAGLAGRPVTATVSEPTFGPGPGPKPGDGHSVINIEPTGETPSAKGKLPSGAKFDITPLDDASMGRRLCIAEAHGDDVLLFVNQDHTYVQKAMEQRPVNRMALELLLTRELADLFERDDDLRQRAFRSRREREEIDAAGDAPGGLIHRLLIDRVRHGPGEEGDAA
jgi:hypothetical protein